MRWYYSLWSNRIRKGVKLLEEQNPSKVEYYDKLTETVTVEEEEYWDLEELKRHLIGYLSKKKLKRTANLLEIIISQRIVLTDTQLKAFLTDLQKTLRKECPRVKWDVTPSAIYLHKN